MKIQSEEEALAILAATRARLIADGYKVAVKLAEEQGGVQAQMVWSEMDRLGLISDEDKKLSAQWLAVVFKGTDYKDSWQASGYRKIGNKERNVHAAPRTWWTLKEF